MAENITKENENKRLKFQKSMKFGALRELTAAKIFMEKDYIVSVPNINARYDFIAEKYPDVYRVQVKTMNLKKRSMNTWYIHTFSFVNGKRRTYTEGDCELIVGVCLDSGNFAIVPICEVIGKTVFNLSEHEQSKGREYLNSYKAIEKNP